MKTKWTYSVFSIQVWNNNKEQHLSDHKTYEAAEKAVVSYSKKPSGNKYEIRTYTT